MRKNLFLLLLLLLCAGASNVAAQEAASALKPAAKTISGGIVNGKATNLVKPAYPAAAKAVNAGGAVNVQVTIDEEGNVISASAVSGHPLLRAAATEAARASKFSPTRLSGQAVKVTGVIVYNFVSDKSIEFKEPYWALGIILSLAQNFEPGMLEEMEGKSGEWNKILVDISTDVPDEFAAQRGLFAKLGTTKDDERAQAARELLISLKNQLQGHQLWQLQVGENLGILMIEAIKFGYGQAGKNYRMDEEALRSSLRNLKTYAASIPPEISSEFSIVIRRIATFANKPDLTSQDRMYELYNSLRPIFETFMNDDR